jgi:hypothetical protein
MKGQTVPDPDHVGRYCKASTVESGEISAAAFMVRESEEYLSVNWLEELNHSGCASQIRDLQKLYAMKFNRVGASARIAVLNVGMVRTKVSNESPDSRLLRVVHEPEEPDDPSHSGIYEIFHDDEIIAELIAQAIIEKYPARA